MGFACTHEEAFDDPTAQDRGRGPDGRLSGFGRAARARGGRQREAARCSARPVWPPAPWADRLAAAVTGAAGIAALPPVASLLITSGIVAGCAWVGGKALSHLGLALDDTSDLP